ncbi:DUF6482 family protein [Salinicola aestuarinus]|uniref:DUF6482 family protein n=1 Tax=Salinicola aestuarinus TaxID=1949082 RepID=UPI000DA23858|nr:DUF6482 family protein [Salinicola aestuarinus]
MTFDEFVKRARQGGVDELQVEAMEGNIYVFHAIVDEDTHTLENASGGVLRPDSLEHARKLLRAAGGLEKLPLYLIQQTAYDEMIGQQSSLESHKTRMSLNTGT